MHPNLLIFKKSILILLLIMPVALIQAQDDFRRSIRGFSYKSVVDGIQITRLVKLGAAEKAGLQVDDIVKSIDGESLTDYESRYRTLSQLPSNRPLLFDIKRGDNALELSISLDPLPKEKFSETNVEYGYLDHEGDRLRTLTTVPKIKRKDKYPAVLLVQWLSCDAIEIPGQPADGMESVIKSFANNPDIIFHRLERSGVGDSRGTACCDLEAIQEIESYKKALTQLKQRPDIDLSNIYILGLSLGTSLAPLVGEDEDIAGYMVSGGSTKTWYEHMLEFERNRLELAGTKPDQVNSAMKGFSDFYYQYLIQKKTPEQIISANPDLESIWYDDPRHQFGRSTVYYQQIQDLNFEKAWSAVDVPVLILYGAYDWVMSLKDHEMIEAAVNSTKKNMAELHILEKTGHLLNTYPSLKDAFDDEIGVINPNAYIKMRTWLQNQLKANGK